MGRFHDALRRLTQRGYFGMELHEPAVNQIDTVESAEVGVDGLPRSKQGDSLLAQLQASLASPLIQAQVTDYSVNPTPGFEPVFLSPHETPFYHQHGPQASRSHLVGYGQPIGQDGPEDEQTYIQRIESLQRQMDLLWDVGTPYLPIPIIAAPLPELPLDYRAWVIGSQIVEVRESFPTSLDDTDEISRTVLEPNEPAPEHEESYDWSSSVQTGTVICRSFGPSDRDPKTTDYRPWDFSANVQNISAMTLPKASATPDAETPPSVDRGGTILGNLDVVPSPTEFTNNTNEKDDGRSVERTKELVQALPAPDDHPFDPRQYLLEHVLGLTPSLMPRMTQPTTRPPESVGSSDSNQVPGSEPLPVPPERLSRLVREEFAEQAANSAFYQPVLQTWGVLERDEDLLDEREIDSTSTESLSRDEIDSPRRGTASIAPIAPIASVDAGGEYSETGIEGELHPGDRPPPPTTYEAKLADRLMNTVYGDRMRELGPKLLACRRRPETAQGLVVIVVGFGDDQERASATMALGMYLCHEQPTLVVDADTLSPTLSYQMGQTGLGLTECLTTGKSWQSTCCATSYASLSLLPHGARTHAAYHPPQDAELDQVRQLVEEWREHYGLILINAGDFESTWATAFSTFAEGAVVCLQLGVTHRDELAEATRRLKSKGSPVLGCLATDIGSF